MKRALMLLISIAIWNGCAVRETKVAKPGQSYPPLAYSYESLAEELARFRMFDPGSFTGRSLVRLLRSEKDLLLEYLRSQGIEDEELATRLESAIEGFSRTLGESIGDPIIGLDGFDRFVADRGLILLKEIDNAIEVSVVCSGDDLQLLTKVFLLTLEETFAEECFWKGWYDFVYAGEVEGVDSLKLGMRANRLPAKYAFKGLFWGIESDHVGVSVILDNGKGIVNLEVLYSAPQKIVVNIPALGPALYPVIVNYTARRGRNDYVEVTLRTFLPITENPSEMEPSSCEFIQ